MSLEPLVSQMDDLARWTWGALELNHDLGMRLGENTLTEFHLLSIANQMSILGLPLQVVPITQNDERRIGADFEFWLRLQTGELFGYSIQAKKVVLGKKHHTYPQLKERGATSTVFQYDTLLEHAQAYNTIAMHVFYNGWPLNQGALYHRSPNALTYGCAAVRSTDVKRLREGNGKRKDNKTTTYAFRSMPWSQLFRIPPTGASARGSGGAVGSPTRTGIAVSPTIEDITMLTRWMRRTSREAETPALSTQLPAYVRQALDLPAAGLPNKPELPRFAVLVNFEELLLER